MHVTLLLEMAAEGFGDRVAVGSRHGGGLTYHALRAAAAGAAGLVLSRRVERLVLLDTNSAAVPVVLFAGGLAGVPVVPLNYRLADEQLQAILARVAPALAVVDEAGAARAEVVDGIEVVGRRAVLEAPGDAGPTEPVSGDPEDVAVLVFTSGTTGEPKGAVLRHRHLTAYVLSTVEYMGAGEEEATLVSVPPYHVAGISAVLSSVYAGRRLVYLGEFSPEAWVDSAVREGITHAMVVPTMLGRILDVVDERGVELPALRHLSYGGGRMPVSVIERAMDRWPEVGFVNAYGLTETSSTVAVLTPDDHRSAMSSDDPAVRARLGSVGRPLPNLEVEIRDPDGVPLAAGGRGAVWVRGEQVAGEYTGRAPSLTADGWFATNDGGWLDDDGYLSLTGRLDDVIVRGAENLSPGEIEEVLLGHPSVAEAAVVGVPDDEWGEVVAAAVVLVEGGAPATEPELRAWVRERLRSARTPVRIEVRDELPINEMGKLLRRVLRDDLGATSRSDR